MEAGGGYAEALAEAQRLGYAEANPAGDVEGHDAQGKVIILAAALMGTTLTAAQVPCEGITRITPEMIARARAERKRYKLVGVVRRTAAGVEAAVAPHALPFEDPLAGISGVTNAVNFRTDLLGSLTVVGPGAGRVETGFALLADLIEVGRGMKP